MDDWRERWLVRGSSDVDTRHGPGWEFAPVEGGPACWAVSRGDGGPFPVFTSERGAGPLPDQTDLLAMTRTVVNDLLAAAGLADPIGWIANNIATALMFASDDIMSWQGAEWALQSGPDDEAVAWSDPGAERTPYAWLQANCGAMDRLVDVYQDDAHFGLRFSGGGEPRFMTSDTGSLRSRRRIPLTEGSVQGADVVYDTSVDGSRAPGVLSEALLRGRHGSTLLIAAEAYSTTEWHLFDESVVALRDPTWADRLDWLPPRQPWRSGGRSR